MGGRLLKMAGDIVFLHVAFLVAFLLRFGGALPTFNFNSYLQIAPWLTVVLIVLANVYDLYTRERRAWADQFSSLVVVATLTTIAAMALSFTARGLSLPRSVVLLVWPLQLALSTGAHLLADRLVSHFRPRERVLILQVAGSGDRVEQAVASGRDTVLQIEPGDAAEAAGLVRQFAPTRLLVGPELPAEVKRAALECGVASRCQVYLVPDLYDTLLHGSRMVSFGDFPALAVDWPVENSSRRLVKRVMDLALAAVGLLMSLPLQLIVGFVIWVTDGRPVLFKQTRTGTGGKQFTLVKFRTMRVDAEAQSGPVLSTGPSDARVTGSGRFLRITRLDELPQLWNVLIGDMSIVGPRPERPFFVERFKGSVPGYAYRLHMKPGLTGLAQVEGRYSTPVDDKLRFDLLYVHSASVWTDLGIVLKTARTIVGLEGLLTNMRAPRTNGDAQSNESSAAIADHARVQRGCADLSEHRCHGRGVARQER